jgi:hypothetical protein
MALLATRVRRNSMPEARRCLLNQSFVEFSFLYTTRSTLDLTFKQSARYGACAVRGAMVMVKVSALGKSDPVGLD